MIIDQHITSIIEERIKSIEIDALKTNSTLFYKEIFSELKGIGARTSKIVENSLTDNETSTKVIRRINAVIIEGLQNVTKHAACLPADSTEEATPSFITITENQESFSLFVGNIIKNSCQDDIENKVKTINELDEQGIKAYHKHILRTGSLSNKGGAGLGYITIAKKAKSKLFTNFIKINAEYSFYDLGVTILK